MKRILYAFRFLSILPIPWKQNEDMKEVAKSMIFFPLVGLLLGLCLCLIEYLLRDKITPLSISLIVVTLWVLFTGGLHLDGLSDLFDGLGGRTPKASLEIMKDSRVGAFGAISLILIILFKITFLRELQLLKLNSSLLYPLLLSPVWSRVNVLLSINFFRSARPGGMGDFFKKEMGLLDWLLSLILTTLTTVLILSPYSLILILPLLGINLLISKKISKKLGGLTGDCYGALSEISETLFLLLFVIFSSLGIL